MAGLYDKYKETGSVKQPKMHDGLKFGDKGFLIHIFLLAVQETVKILK
jgi:hypothetical protein